MLAVRLHSRRVPPSASIALVCRIMSTSFQTRGFDERPSRPARQQSRHHAALSSGAMRSLFAGRFRREEMDWHKRRACAAAEAGDFANGAR